MSYDISLCDPVTGKTLDEPHQMRGGTYAIGGTTCMELNITYNYSKHYRRVIDPESGIRWLYGKTGAETIPRLEWATSLLGDDTSDDYWESTEGNAKRALMQLLALAKMRPDGVWSGD